MEQSVKSRRSFPFEWWDGINAHLSTIKKRKPTLKLKRFLLSASRNGYRLRGYYSFEGKEIAYDAISNTVKDLPDKLTETILATPLTANPSERESEAKYRRSQRASLALKMMTRQLYGSEDTTPTF